MTGTRLKVLRAPCSGLSLYGVSVQCQTGSKLGSWRAAPRSGLLFTHAGYSGPSVLDLSHHAVQALEQPGSPRPGLRPAAGRQGVSDVLRVVVDYDTLINICLMYTMQTTSDRVFG